MKHTPMGYEIADGKIRINEEEAEKIRTMFAVYLMGGSYKAAAQAAGLDLQHSGVKRILQNEKYLGGTHYPAIIDQQTFDAAEKERVRREHALGRDQKCKRTKISKYYLGFSMPQVERKFLDPIKQTEYAYKLIRNEVSG